MSKKIEKLKVAKKGEALVWNDLVRKINEIIEVVNKLKPQEIISSGDPQENKNKKPEEAVSL